MCGYDYRGQFILSWRNGDTTTSTYGSDLLHSTCAICLRGWEATSASLLDQTHWPLLDEYVHESCLVRYCGLTERSRFTNAMSEARLAYSGFRVIENGYWPKGDPWEKKPWYEADLRDYAATIVLGWRKNVAHVEVRAWPSSKLNAAQSTVLFSGEEVTKCFESDRALIHAWSDVKVADYLCRFAALLRTEWLTTTVATNETRP